MQSLIAKCKSGVPEDIKISAKREGLDSDALLKGVLRGHVVIPHNPLREISPCAIGEGCRIKINVNIGTSGVRCDPEYEIAKAKCAIECGADAIMDLSTGEEIRNTRRKILNLGIPVGTVPVYEAVRRAGSVNDLDADLLFRVIREHCRDGVDFLTLHCGVNLDAFSALKNDPRIMGVVSRGGAFHIAMMESSGEENPLYSEYDYLMEILAEEGVTISLGDGMRPGSVVDADKRAKSVEYLTLGELAKKALGAGVQRMIEGPGHMPVHQIGYNVQMIKELTENTPLYLLGPLVTDIAPGYDHVSAAIGGTIAAMNGADFLCMVSPSEHLALPGIDDIKEGTRVAKIAAHVGDSVRLEDRWYEEGEASMAFARRNLDWETQFRIAMFGDHARSIHERDGDLDTCSMCGDLCAVKMVDEILPKVEKK